MLSDVLKNMQQQMNAMAMPGKAKGGKKGNKPGEGEGMGEMQKTAKCPNETDCRQGGKTGRGSF